jgi:hypothetical protein
MSKPNQKGKVELVEANDFWQFEHSINLADDFINDELLPLLDQFETDNDDTDYIDGAATHGLFVALVMRMAELGYTEKALRKELKVYLNSSMGQVVH